MINLELARANPEMVKALMDHLIKAYEDFLNERDGNVDFVDGFMAVHNFHCVIILDIERKAGMDAEGQLFWRKIAVDTFRGAMENKPAFKQEGKRRRKGRR